jgi:hypothetical protein
MEMIMPASFAVIEEEELSYLDGGKGLWDNWSIDTFLRGFTISLGSACITAGTTFLLNQITATGSIAGGFAAVATTVAGFSAGQYVLLGMCTAAAVYTFVYQAKQIYDSCMSLYHTYVSLMNSIEQESAEAETNGLMFAIA